MTGDAPSAQDDECVTLVRGDPPPWLECWVIVVAAGETLAGGVLEGSHAIAVIEHGSIVLEQRADRLTLDEGAVFCTAGLHLVAIRNEGPAAAVIACARRRPAQSRP